MINEMKNLWIMGKYASNRKACIICIICFIPLALFNLFVTEGMFGKVIATFIFMGIPFMISQMDYSVLASGFALSSPKSRKYALGAMALLNGIMSMVTYMILGFVVFYVVSNQGYSEKEIGFAMFLGSIMTALMSIYMGLAYKKYILALICFLAVVYGVIFYSAFAYQVNPYAAHAEWNVSYLGSYFIGGIIILLGNAGFYITARLVYRLPYDKRALRSPLQRE